MKDSTVYGGSDLYTDHYLLMSEIYIAAKWRKIKVNEQRKIQQQKIFKTHLLQEHSIRELYQRRISMYLNDSVTAEDVEEEWKNLKRVVSKTAN